MNGNVSTDITSGSTLKVFLKFTLPNVLGFIAMSSSSIVDGIFVGNFVGSSALAAVNMVMPIFTLVLGVSIMLTIGGAVRVGKFLGENNIEKASETFTKIIIVITAIALTMTIVCALLHNGVVKILGVNDELKSMSVSYLRMLSLFFFFFAIEYSFSVFVRIDGRPFLSSTAVILGALTNFALDYLFIVKFHWGVSGAAFATGISFIVSFVILSTHFVSGKNKLRFTRQLGKWKEIFSAAYNGSSELLSEFSSGFLAFLLNWIMITKIGTQGVAAFTFINYSIWAGCMLCYAVGDSIVPLVSINYGARQPKRIKKFVGLALCTVMGIGVIIFTIMALAPEKMVSLLLPDTKSEAFQIALVFASFIKWVFLFNGVNIIFSAYFTAIHRPLESVIIAGSRGLVLPVLFLFGLPYIMGVQGIYAAIPLADIATLAIAFFLWKKNSPVKRIERPKAMC